MQKAFTNLCLLSFLALGLSACGGGDSSSNTTVQPTALPTAEPTAVPTLQPTTIPTLEPSEEPNPTPTPEPTPTPQPTPEVTVSQLHSLASFPVGVAVPAGSVSNSVLTSEERQAIVETHFSQLTAENIMKPNALRPSEFEFEFTNADALVTYASTEGLTVHGHTLVWHSQIPAWMQNYTGDQTASQQMMENHIAGVIGHFETNHAGTVVSWDVVNEAFTDGNPSVLRESIWFTQVGSSYIDLAFEAADLAASNAVDLYYNDYNLLNNGAKLTAVLAKVQQMIDDGVPIDGIGFQGHIRLDTPSIDSITAALTQAAETGLKVKITELDVSRQAIDNDSLTEATPELHIALMARYEEVVAAYLAAVPEAQRGGISVWGITDADSWLTQHRGKEEFGLLFNADFSAKPALQGFADGLTGQ